MTIAEEKLELIQKIIACNDITILMEIKAILLADKNHLNEPSTSYEKKEKIYVFNEWQQERIHKSIKQVEKGEFLTEEEAEKDIQEWFKEQEKLFGQ